MQEDVVYEAAAFAQGDEIQIVGEIVEVDVRLFERIGRIEFHVAVAGKGTQEVDDYRQPGACGRRGDVPLEGVAEHGDEIDLEMWLAAWPEGVDIAVGFLGVEILFARGEIVVDAGKPDELEKTAAERSAFVLSVGGNGAVVLGTCAQEVIFETQAIFESEDVWHDGVI